MNKRIDAVVFEKPILTKKQRHALMRERNKKPLPDLTGGDDYYHKQSAHTIKWLLCSGAIAFIICGIAEVVK